MTSAFSTAALRHLKKLKPADGWSLDYQKNDKHKQQQPGGVRLQRRRVPLTEHYFLDLYVNPTDKTVVGILSAPRAGSTKAYGQVLVDATGQPVTKRQTVSVTGWTATTTTTTRSAASNSTATSDAVPVLSDEQNLQLLKFGAMGIGGILVLKFVLHAALILYVLALPLLYVYLVGQCPADDSFDAKRELKRVMRGHHLPENHPDKPKGFLSETLARLNAAVTTEVATGMLGYEITIISLGGAAKVACVRVPAAKMDYYWAGMLGRWYYVYSSEIAEAA